MPRNPLDVLAQQVVATARRAQWPADELLRLWSAAPRTLPTWPRLVRGDAGHARRPLPGRTSSPSCGRASIWDRAGGHGREPARRADGGRHQWRHDPRPRPVRRVPGRRRDRQPPDPARGPAGARRRPARGRARRGDGLRGARGRGDPARRQRLAHRTDHPRPGARLAGARASRARSVLEGRGAGPADRAGPRAGRVHARVRRGRASGRRAQARRGREAAARRAQARRARRAATCWTTSPRNSAVTGALPTDRTIVLERFRDELGDWRICLLTPFGARVHAPWALAIEARLRERLGLDVQPIWSDDGIVVRLPDDRRPRGDGLPTAAEPPSIRPRRRC